VELGCGDGNQLDIGKYPKYLGLDVSNTAVVKTRERFRDMKQYRFAQINIYDDLKSEFGMFDVAMSLDVLMHLVEIEVYITHLLKLFSLAKKYVIVFAPNHDEPRARRNKLLYRKFTRYVAAAFPQWEIAALHLVGSIKQLVIYRRSSGPSEPHEVQRHQ
jgi:2-polyprenyl-3-methyl-5-hydroxy-6-metoxy-1,4-benzoquinol methylase